VRPRCTPLGEGLLVNPRGVNLNPGADPEDMVAVNDIRDRLAAGTGPLDAGDFLVELATRPVERMGSAASRASSGNGPSGR
jgi:zinc transporter